MIGQRTALTLFGCEVYDPYGHRIGIVGQLFIDDGTEQPAWVTVQSGLFGTNEKLVPLEGAQYSHDRLFVAVSKESVRAAPRTSVEPGGDLLLEQEYCLYLHYGLELGHTLGQAEPVGEPESTSTRAGDAEPDAESATFAVAESGFGAESRSDEAYSDPREPLARSLRMRLRRWAAAG